jgi:hypothetical protein
VAARDAADTVVTTYRQWMPRLRGDHATSVARLAVTSAYAAGWAGLSTIAPDDGDGCGRPALLPPLLPALEDAAEAPLPVEPGEGMAEADTVQRFARHRSTFECAVG